MGWRRVLLWVGLAAILAERGKPADAFRAEVDDRGASGVRVLLRAEDVGVARAERMGFLSQLAQL